MVAILFLLSALLSMVLANPQRNAPVRERRPTGQEFVDLLPDDFTNEEYDALLDEFVEFLEIKDKKLRGDFVDLDKLECTPKVPKVVMYPVTIYSYLARKVHSGGPCTV